MTTQELHDLDTLLCNFLTENSQMLTTESESLNADKFTFADITKCLKKLLTV